MRGTKVVDSEAPFELVEEQGTLVIRSFSIKDSQH